MRHFLRTLFGGRCETCQLRWCCWRWHVERFLCPTCGTTVDEFDERFIRIADALFAVDQIPPKSTQNYTWMWNGQKFVEMKLNG